jgi:ATP-dependent exoDNAse (exonuclease V) alpha subunit
MEQRWITREVWDLERDMLRRSLRRQDDRVVSIRAQMVREEMESWQKRRGRSLTDGQRRMIHDICLGRGDVLVIEGRAGTGKTAAAEVVRCAFERAGLTVVGAALPGRAGVQLAQDSGIRSETIATTLQSLERGLALPRGSALLVDEAGMVGSADTAKLVGTRASRGGSSC